MPKTYTDSGFAPTAVLKEEGAMIKGVLGAMRQVETKWGAKPVYKLTVLDASCKFVVGKEEVTPEPESVVDIFTTTRLAAQLAKVPVGETITIRYLGTKPSGKGKPAHTFSVIGE